jgi:hypothetical protein
MITKSNSTKILVATEVRIRIFLRLGSIAGRCIISYSTEKNKKIVDVFDFP